MTQLFIKLVFFRNFVILITHFNMLKPIYDRLYSDLL